MCAGTGRCCANPPPDIAHGGWGAQKHEQAEGIDLDLWATALALSDGTTTAVILDIDIQILTNERADQIRTAVSRATGLPVATIRACATHTHSGPVPYKSWIEKGYHLVAPWFDDLARWCAEAAVEAVANLQRVELRAGAGECRINANRRCTTAAGERFLGVNPDGPSTKVSVVQSRWRSGPPVAYARQLRCVTIAYDNPAGNRLLTGLSGRCTRRGGKPWAGAVFFSGVPPAPGPVQGFRRIRRFIACSGRSSATRSRKSPSLKVFRRA